MAYNVFVTKELHCVGYFSIVLDYILEVSQSSDEGSEGVFSAATSLLTMTARNNPLVSLSLLAKPISLHNQSLLFSHTLHV